MTRTNSNDRVHTNVNDDTYVCRETKTKNEQKRTKKNKCTRQCMIALPIQDRQRTTKEAYVCASVTKSRTLANAFCISVVLQTRPGNAPQAGVAGHCFGAGLSSSRQLSLTPPPLEHTTAPLGPSPALIPHLVGQPVGSLRVQAVGEGCLCVVCVCVCVYV